METNSTGDATIIALFFLLASLAVTWVVIYTAVRAATSHALDRREPRLNAEAKTSPEGVEVVVNNFGTAPALAVEVRWSEPEGGMVLAQTPLLAVGGTLSWNLAVPAVPDETMTVRKLNVSWANNVDPSYPRKSATRLVLVPSRLDKGE